jgi:hypothetical protein
MKKINLIGGLFIILVTALLYSMGYQTNKQLFCNKAIDQHNCSSTVSEDLFSSSFLLMGFN